MNDEKSIFASKTFWGSIITAIGGITALFGQVIEADMVSQLATSLAILGGAAFSIYGRIKAETAIK